MRNYKSILFISFLFLFIGCTSFMARRIPLSLERPKECQAFLSALDEAVEQAGVKNAASYPVPGFPYLRTNRFLSFLKDNFNDQEGREQWCRWMQNLDLETRKKETSNLPNDIVSSFSMPIWRIGFFFRKTNNESPHGMSVDLGKLYAPYEGSKSTPTALILLRVMR